MKKERKRSRHFLSRWLPDKSKYIKNQDGGNGTKEPEDKQGRLVLVRQGKVIKRQGATRRAMRQTKYGFLPPVWP